MAVPQAILGGCIRFLSVPGAFILAVYSAINGIVYDRRKWLAVGVAGCCLLVVLWTAYTFAVSARTPSACP